MFNKKVNKLDAYKEISELRPGNITKEDIYANTKHPIVAKDTKLTLEHIEVLQAFGILQVLIELKVAAQKTADEEDGEQTPAKGKATAQPAVSLQAQYDQAVEAYRKEFNSYRSGKKVDISAVRASVLPVIQSFLENKDQVRLLNDFSSTTDYIAHHSVGVGILAAVMSEQLGYPQGHVLQIGIAGVLADCGMAKIDPKIINKVAFLSKSELNEVKKHVIYSYQMIQDSTLMRQEMKVAIFQHHERYDGSGYPRGSKAQEITEIAQIISVADVFHAMTSERPYRKKETPFKVMEQMKEEEFGKFDVRVVQVLHNLINKLSIGTKVKLTTGEKAEVMYLHRDTPLRPVVKVYGSDTTLDLSANRKIGIEMIL